MAMRDAGGAEGRWLVMLATLGALAPRLSPGTAWRLPVAAYGEALWVDLMERTPEHERDRLDTDLVDAAKAAWRHLSQIPEQVQATEEGARAAADFSAPPTDGTSP